MSFNALLPSAKIAVFTQDNQTKDVMASLDGDWRFARVEFDIQIGDVETATTHYESERSPDLLIIQTKDIGEGFLAQLEKLAERFSLDPSDNRSIVRKATEAIQAHYQNREQKKDSEK